jgi:hypothetical protein
LFSPYMKEVVSPMMETILGLVFQVNLYIANIQIFD